VDCLTAESKSVEAKLQVLTAALSYYTDLRPSHDAAAAEADALGHYLFMYVLCDIFGFIDNTSFLLSLFS